MNFYNLNHHIDQWTENRKLTCHLSKSYETIITKETRKKKQIDTVHNTCIHKPKDTMVI